MVPGLYLYSIFLVFYTPHHIRPSHTVERGYHVGCQPAHHIHTYSQTIRSNLGEIIYVAVCCSFYIFAFVFLDNWVLWTNTNKDWLIDWLIDWSWGIKYSAQGHVDMWIGGARNRNRLVDDHSTSWAIATDMTDSSRCVNRLQSLLLHWRYTSDSKVPNSLNCLYHSHK